MPDVTLVQAALTVSSGTDFNGKIGVRQNDQFFRALARFLAKHAPEEGSLLLPNGKGIVALNNALPDRFKALKVWRSSNIAYLDNTAAKVLTWKEGQHPLPHKQTADLLRSINRWDFARKFGLDIADVDTTPDGSFRVRLAFTRGQFLDPDTGRLVNMTPAIQKRTIENLLVQEWKASSRTALVFVTRATWPILARSREAIQEELELVGLKRRPSNRVLKQCSNALSAAAFHETLDVETRKTLTQCFGAEGRQIEAKILAREGACQNLKSSWRSLMARHVNRLEALISIAQQFNEAYWEKAGLSLTARQLDARNLVQAAGNVPAGDLAKFFSDIKNGKGANEAALDLLGSRDGLGVVAEAAEEVGAKTTARLARILDVAKLAKDTNEVFWRSVEVTKLRVADIPRLEEEKLRLWIAFYNAFADFDAEVKETRTLLLGFRANGCKTPPEAATLPDVWRQVLLKEYYFARFEYLKEEAQQH